MHSCTDHVTRRSSRVGRDVEVPLTEFDVIETEATDDFDALGGRRVECRSLYRHPRDRKRLYPISISEREPRRRRWTRPRTARLLPAVYRDG